MTKKKEVKIGGAGISGLTAAIILARAGYKVKVYEKNADVGERFNEDFQGIMNWGFKEDVLNYMNRNGIKTDFWKKEMTFIDMFGSDKYHHTFKTKLPFCYLVQRGKNKKCLEQSLKEQAIDVGVDIIFNNKVNEDDVDIIATGPKFDGVIDGLVSGYTFKTDSQDRFALLFDDNYAYNGYSYFFTTNGRGTVATCIFGNYEKVNDYLKKTYDFFIESYDFDIKNQKRFTGTGNFYLLADTKKKYVGEAGGFQDFLWGFGMRYAIITGNLVAKSIIEKKEYKELWAKELNGLLETSVSTRLLFSFLGDKTYRLFVKFLSKKKDPVGFLTKIYNPTLLTRLIYPFSKIYFGKNIKDRNSKSINDK